MSEEEPTEEGGGSGCRAKNKNPTQRCGELKPLCQVVSKSTWFSFRSHISLEITDHVISVSMGALTLLPFKHTFSGKKHMVHGFKHTSDCPRSTHLHLLPKQPLTWRMFHREIVWPMVLIQLWGAFKSVTQHKHIHHKARNASSSLKS